MSPAFWIAGRWLRRGFVACALLIPGAAQATNADLSAQPAGFAEMRKVGQTSFGFLFWNFFEAELRTTSGVFDWQQPMALSLTYRTDFSADELVATTIEEMQRVSDWPRQRIEELRPEISACMANVGDGDQYMAYSPGPSIVELHLNGQKRCRLSGPGLRKAYLGIWLSENSRFPEKSLALRGGGS